MAEDTDAYNRPTCPICLGSRFTVCPRCEYLEQEEVPWPTDEEIQAFNERRRLENRPMPMRVIYDGQELMIHGIAKDTIHGVSRAGARVFGIPGAVTLHAGADGEAMDDDLCAWDHLPVADGIRSAVLRRA